ALRLVLAFTSRITRLTSGREAPARSVAATSPAREPLCRDEHPPTSETAFAPTGAETRSSDREPSAFVGDRAPSRRAAAYDGHVSREWLQAGLVRVTGNVAGRT